MIFFIMAIGTAVTSSQPDLRSGARREGYTEIANASFCYLLSMAGYLTSIIFPPYRMHTCDTICRS